MNMPGRGAGGIMGGIFGGRSSGPNRRRSRRSRVRGSGFRVQEETMGVIVQCRCGNYVTIASERGETQGRCPQCGQAVMMPAVGTPRADGMMMGGGPIAVPTMVPDKLRSADKPPVYLTIRADRVNLMATFDTSPVLISFVEGFAKK